MSASKATLAAPPAEVSTLPFKCFRTLATTHLLKESEWGGDSVEEVAQIHFPNSRRSFSSLRCSEKVRSTKFSNDLQEKSSLPYPDVPHKLVRRPPLGFGSRVQEFSTSCGVLKGKYSMVCGVLFCAHLFLSENLLLLLDLKNLRKICSAANNSILFPTAHSSCIARMSQSDVLNVCDCIKLVTQHLQWSSRVLEYLNSFKTCEAALCLI